MMQIVLKVCHRFSHRADAFRNLLMVHQYFSKRISRKTVPGHQIKKFPEWETSQVIRNHLARQVGIFLFQPHDGRTGKNDLQVGEVIVTIAEFFRPSRIFEHLVDQQHFSPFCPELRSKIDQRTFRKIKMIQIYVKTLFIIRAKMLAGIIQQKSRLSHSARPLNADQPIIPVDLVHQPSANRRIQVFYQIFMCFKECFHFFNWQLTMDNWQFIHPVKRSKYRYFFRIAMQSLQFW